MKSQKYLDLGVVSLSHSSGLEVCEDVVVIHHGEELVLNFARQQTDC